MDWAEHAICWHVYPLGFLGAPIHDIPADFAPQRRLRDLVPWLDDAIELGASALLLGPIFASASHGYDTVDYFRIDPRLGDEQDFDILVRECHQRGLRVILDGVFNHVGSDHPRYRQALEQGPHSDAASWFRIDFNAPGGPAAEVFEGHGALINLDHDSPAVVELVADVMNHWCERGADGWRLDAAYAVRPEFWAQVLPGVREAHPEIFVFGEVIHGDYVELVERSGWDSLTQYELWKAIWSSLKDVNFFELAHALRRHQEFCAQFAPVTFIGNHDVTRIAAQVGPERAVLAAVILMTVPGTPCVYYGDEYAATAVKEERAGGDDAVRPEFPSTPGELDNVTWLADGRWMLDVHRALISVRRRHPWLHRGVVQIGDLTNEGLSYEVSPPEGSDADGARLRVTLDNEAPSARIVAVTGDGDELLFEYHG
ncbi:glycosidase [Kineosphaera limosa]|uniref:Putative glycoside hydrolase n=1 Tax=Kineosphaera limosa NBRC 100340 TaxID=1184609 RepID=K6VGZ6_9MICO|nr:alpha-amylase family protein [Kineosphaera limosa]NYE01360.1 glycosidase [Kineosphaera limosa]GAB95468.1 putative glycoside hydrolase [Kineosphaera limosa NBRC 100340]